MDDNVLQGKTLLVVDDEADLRDIVASELEFMGGRPLQAENITAAKKVLGVQTVDLIVSDIRMPGGTGIDLLDTIKGKDVNYPPILLITGFADITTQEAYARGAEALMNKPFKLDDLIAVAARLTGPLEKRFQVEDLVASRELRLSYPDEMIAVKEVALGRGGFALQMDNSGERFEIGEVIRFDLKFSDHHICGVGIIRWVRHPENHDGHIAIGIEFMKMDKECLEFALENFRQARTKSLIPAL